MVRQSQRGRRVAVQFARTAARVHPADHIDAETQGGVEVQRLEESLERWTLQCHCVLCEGKTARNIELSGAFRIGFNSTPSLLSDTGSFERRAIQTHAYHRGC
jgi:hypothetical protein